MLVVVVHVTPRVDGGGLVVESVVVLVEVELVDVAGGTRKAACWWWCA